MSLKVELCVSCFLALFILETLAAGMHAMTEEELECRNPLFHRYTYEDLEHSGLSQYSKVGVKDFSQIVTDPENNQLLVGARDHLMRLDLNTLSPIEVAEWRPNEISTATCESKGESHEDCCNYIRVLLVYGDQIFTCGTNAFNPVCTYRQKNNLTSIVREVTGIARCPYNPHHNTTALITEDGDLYTGTVMDFMARDAVVYRTLGPSPPLRTAQLNSKWLNNPNFVSSYEIGQYVYFFFRETAVEYSNCGQIIYSRVARVCKSDSGGNFLLEENWTTFRKARLNCSVPGRFPFEFNEIESTYYENETDTIFAVFSTPSNSIHGSAVCAFTVEAIDYAFSGPFKFQPNAVSAWITRPNANPQGCNNRADRLTRPGQIERYLVDAQKYQLMDRAVEAVDSRPLFIQKQEVVGLDQIVVDTVQGKDQMYYVSFIGTKDGKIKKIVKLDGIDNACILEELCVSPMHKCDPLKTIKIDKSQNALYIGLPENVIKVPVQRCFKFETERACLNARDPYCGWRTDTNECTTYPSNPELLEFWIQDITSCPIVDNAVDGGFGEWSNWTQCSDPEGLEACMCRNRECNSPEPKCGGATCVGEYQQVVNCTGRNSPSTALSYRPGFWGDWTSWSQCTSACNGGIQTRVRHCVNGQACVGDTTQTRECNKQTCTEIRRPTDWTPWLVHNVSEDGLLMQRFRYICRAQVPERNMISIGRLKGQFKFCPFSSTSKRCWGDSEHFGGWTMWSPWLPCSSTCGDGVQVRHRSCFPDNAECNGQYYEKRDCLSYVPCPVHGGWSCWGEWSECSVSCGRGTKQRQRFCTNPEPLNDGLDCVGPNTEEVPCDGGSCNKQGLIELPDWPGLSVRSGQRDINNPMGSAMTPELGSSDGWKEWSKWTSCSHKGRRHRSRKCETATPSYGQCWGCIKQIDWCFADGEESSNFQAPEVQRLQAGPPKCKAESESMEPLYFCIVGLVSAIAGSIMSLSVYMSWQKNHKVREDEFDDDDDEIGDMGHYSDSEYSYDGSDIVPNITSNPTDLENER